MTRRPKRLARDPENAPDVVGEIEDAKFIGISIGISPVLKGFYAPSAAGVNDGRPALITVESCRVIDAGQRTDQDHQARRAFACAAAVQERSR
jgi:hypothetical protein